MMFRMLTLAGLLVAASAALTGCNTLAGAGRDMQGIGRSVVWAVDGTAHYIQDVSAEDDRLASAPWPADPYLPDALPPDTRLVFTEEDALRQSDAQEPYYDVNYEASYEAHRGLNSY